MQGLIAFGLIRVGPLSRYFQSGLRFGLNSSTKDRYLHFTVDGGAYSKS